MLVPESRDKDFVDQMEKDYEPSELCDLDLIATGIAGYMAAIYRSQASKTGDITAQHEVFAKVAS